MKTKIYIDDVIGAISFFDEGLTAKFIRDQLDKAEGDIEIHINSPGGSVFQGQEIYSAIKDYSKGTVTIIIDALAGSIASVIAFAGDGLPMIRLNAAMMIHNPSTVAMGTADDLRKTIKALDTVKKSIIAVYEDAVPESELNFSQLMDDVTWYDAQAAIDAGLAVEFTEDDEATNSVELVADASMSFEDMMRSFVEAKRDRDNSATDTPEPQDQVDAIEPDQADTDIDPEIEDQTPEFSNETARRRYVEILTEEATAGMA